MKFTITRYNASHHEIWDNFVSRAKNATFFFFFNFMDYHAHRFEDYSLMVYKGSKLFALLPAHKMKHSLCSHNGLTYGGLVLSEQAKLLEVYEAFKTLLEFLDEAGFQKMELKIIPTFYNTSPSDELAFLLYKANAHLMRREVLMVIDYQNQLPFQKNRREGLNKAKRNGLELRVDENYEGFWNEVLIPNLASKHQVAPVHSLAEIQLLAARFPENIKQVSVYKEGKIVAGTTVFLTKTTVHPQYVSGNRDKNADGSLDLAYDFAINHFKQGRRYFDFNISSEENGTVLNQGLIFWKETCVARTFVADNYSVVPHSYKQLNLILK